MSKPDWKDAPEWANYLAMDKNGDWYWYELIPKISLNKESWLTETARFTWAGDYESDWKETLEERPNE